MIYFAILFLLVCIYVGWGYTIVGQNQAAVVERFGKFNRVIFPGWHILCLPGLIDRLTESLEKHNKFVPTLQRFPVKVFDKGELIDVVDDSVGIDINVWVQIGDPNLNPPYDLSKKEDRDLLAVDVCKYVYGAKDSKAYVSALMDDRIRPIIQSLRLEEALKIDSEKALGINPANPTHDPKAELKEPLRVVGLYLAGKDCLTIGDFNLSEKTKALRAKILEAQKSQEARIAAAKGFRLAAEVLANGEPKKDAAGNIIATPDSEKITIREAVEAQNRLAALETLKGSELRLVQSTTGAALDAIMDLAGQQGGGNQGQRPQGGNPRPNQQRNNQRNQT